MSEQSVSIAVFVLLAVTSALLTNRLLFNRGAAAVTAAFATVVGFFVVAFVRDGQLDPLFPIGIVFGFFYAVLITGLVTFVLDRASRRVSRSTPRPR